MTKTRLGLACASLLLLPALASAGQIVVPTDQPTLQDALNVANFGDVIIVRTTAYQENITIPTKVTIIGDPVCNISNGSFCGGGATNFGVPAITLNGPGSGTLELVNLLVGGGDDCPFPAPSIVGGGFSQIAIYDSLIYGPATGLTGAGHGAPAISTGVPSILVSNSTVIGSNPDTGGTSCTGSIYDEREAGIEAPGSTVLVFDSVVRGGSNVSQLCCSSCGCPGSLAGLGGEGGDGIIADRVFYDASSTIAGGVGVEFIAYSGSMGSGGTSCGKQPDGAPFVANQVVQIANDLTGTGAMRIGQPYTLAWNSSSAASVLYFAVGPGNNPIQISAGWAFGDPSTASVLSIVPGGPQVFNFTMPYSPNLLGVELLFQLLDPIDGLSRPVAGILQP